MPYSCQDETGRKVGNLEEFHKFDKSFLILSYCTFVSRRTLFTFKFRKGVVNSDFGNWALLDFPSSFQMAQKLGSNSQNQLGHALMKI